MVNVVGQMIRIGVVRGETRAREREWKGVEGSKKEERTVQVYILIITN